ncbi:MAG: 50S ribosomal protein L21 [Patescibacteria group bacterium]
MTFAVIATGGKQYLVEEGRFIVIEKIGGLNVGDVIEFDQVLMIDDGSKTNIGMPTVGKKVKGTILEAGKDHKKIVIKYKAKSRYFKKRGHRQPFLKVKIDKIS